MDGPSERSSKAVAMSMDSGMSASMGAAAPIGAVSRRTRLRAGRTSLQREGTSVLLRTALPGSSVLQRQADDGTWETLERRSTSRRGRTRIELPQEAGSSASTFRVVFSPRNANVPSWVSEPLHR
jgi:hypothetical protein